MYVWEIKFLNINIVIAIIRGTIFLDSKINGKIRNMDKDKEKKICIP